MNQFDPRRSLRPSRFFRLAGACLVGLVLLVGCTPSSEQDDSTRNDDGEIVDGGDVGAFALSLGDCVQVPGEDDDEVFALEGVACSDPHTAQVYALRDLTNDEFPGVEAVSDLSGDVCLEEWEGALGTVYDDDMERDVYFLYPTAETWDIGDREVVCLVVMIDGSDMVGSAISG